MTDTAVDKSLGADGLVGQLLVPVRESLLAMSKDLKLNPSWLYVLSLRLGELFREVSRNENTLQNGNSTNTAGHRAAVVQAAEELTVAYALEGTADNLASAANQILGSVDMNNTGAMRVQSEPVELSEEEYNNTTGNWTDSDDSSDNSTGNWTFPPSPTNGSNWTFPPSPTNGSNWTFPPSPTNGSNWTFPPSPTNGSNWTFPPSPTNGSNWTFPPSPTNGSNWTFPPSPTNGSNWTFPPSPTNGSNWTFPPSPTNGSNWTFPPSPTNGSNWTFPPSPTNGSNWTFPPSPTNGSNWTFPPSPTNGSNWTFPPSPTNGSNWTFPPSPTNGSNWTFPPSPTNGSNWTFPPSPTNGSNWTFPPSPTNGSNWTFPPSPTNGDGNQTDSNSTNNNGNSSGLPDGVRPPSSNSTVTNETSGNTNGTRKFFAITFVTDTAVDKSLGADGLVGQLLVPVRESLLAMSKDLKLNPSWLYVLSLRLGELFREVSRNENTLQNGNSTNTAGHRAAVVQAAEELTVAYALEGTADNLASAANQILGSVDTKNTGAMRVQGAPVELSEEEYKMLLENRAAQSSSDDDFPTWAIVLICVVGAILLVLVVAVAMYFVTRTPTKQQTSKEDTKPVDMSV